MVIFRWSPELESGIELIDQQHRKIVELFNTFFIRRKCGNETPLVEECLLFLEQYILYHFQAEEAFQSECSYPDYRSHQATHKALATQVKIFSVRLRSSGYAPDEMQAFCDFLYEWLGTHLRRDDCAFMAYYKAFKEGQSAALLEQESEP